jgi:hypothetical protein
VKTAGKREEYFLKRASSGCANCGSLDVTIDAISKLCTPCKKHMLVHGSPRIKKPLLKEAMELANLRISYHCKLQQTKRAFDDFMLSFASPSKSDPLRRLCWLHYFQLKAWDGEPLMDFRGALVQSYAVTLFEEYDGRFDGRKKQYQYCLGRSVVCLWNQRRQTVQGYHYDKNERNDLQRKPTLMLRAFDEIFMGSGLARYLSKLNNKIRSKNNDGTKIPSYADRKPRGQRTI